MIFSVGMIALMAACGVMLGAQQVAERTGSRVAWVLALVAAALVCCVSGVY